MHLPMIQQGGILALLPVFCPRFGQKEKGGESIYKPGSVLNSHSSTMAITGHL